jgi:hypothetical protein
MGNTFDRSKYKWREVTPSGESYLVHHWYTILGYSKAAGTLDMLVRWGNDGGHCNLHRHIATTTVFVIEGEQHLYDYDANGNKADQPRIRRNGDYGLSVGAEKPHLERGGPEGGLALFSTRSNNGVLYEILDDDFNLILPITIDFLVADFNEFAR